MDLSSACMELALKERQDTRETTTMRVQWASSHGDGASRMLWRVFQLAFRVYSFIGGQDEWTDRLTSILAAEHRGAGASSKQEHVASSKQEHVPEQAASRSNSKQQTASSRRRKPLARPHGHGIMPHQHEKPTWRGMDLSDTAYKIYGPKKPL